MSSSNSTTTNTDQSPNLSKKELRQLKEQLKAKARLRQRAPKYIIMMGLPASGKSTFSNRLATEWEEQIEKSNMNSHIQNKSNSNKKWKDVFIIANQDKLGKKECISLVSKSSKTNRIILDRCNPSASDRKEWVDILHNPPKCDIALLYFASSAQSCIERAHNRVGHETIPEGRGERIVNDMARRFEPPTDDERKIFGSVIIVEHFDQCDDILRMWGC